MIFDNSFDIGDILSAVSIFVLLFGGFFSLIQWKKRQLLKRGEYINELTEKIRADNDIREIVYLFDYNDKRWYTNLFHGCGEFEIKVDKTLSYFSYICYLKKKRLITSDEFDSGVYDFRFMVISDRLHNGKNYSSITFSTSTQIITVPVNIDNKIRVRISDINPRSRLISLERLYLDLKMDRIQLWDWSGESLGLLNDISAGDEEGLYLMLYKAQVHLSRNDAVNARNYIEYVGTQIPKLDNKNYDLYCYFIYLASLYEDVPGVKNAFLKYDSDIDDEDASDRDRDPYVPGPYASGSYDQKDYDGGKNFMEMSAVQKVRWVYRYYPSWRILWILLYMDPEFRKDKELVLSHMRGFFDDGLCISPAMYLEALNIFMQDPSLITQAGQFELQVFNFANKNNCISLKISEVLAQRVLESSNSAYTDSKRRLASELICISARSPWIL